MGNGGLQQISHDPNEDGEAVGITRDNIEEHNQRGGFQEKPLKQRREEECVSPDANEDRESVGTTQDSVGNQPNVRENKEEHNQRRKTLERSDNFKIDCA